jgi:AcrR family transcriptional regulator
MSDGRTAIRERTGETILDSAMDALTEDPSAGMVAIAERAGVGRATLYRHYPTREALVDALQDRVRAAFRGLIEELLADEDAPAVALERFVTELLELREGWACIAPRETAGFQSRVRAVWAPLETYVTRLQAAGAIDPELAPGWVRATLRGPLRAAVTELDAGRLERGAAPALVVRTFLRGVTT